MILSSLRDAIITAIGSALPSVREIKPHGGRFSLDELKAAAARAPSVRVACLGLAEVNQAPTCVEAVSIWGAFVIVSDQPTIRRDALVLGLAAALASLVPDNCWGLPDQTDGARQVRADNLFSRELDRQGVALWAITWRQTVDIVPEDLTEIDDFLRAYVDWDINQDGTADFTDVIELPAATPPAPDPEPEPDPEEGQEP